MIGRPITSHSFVWGLAAIWAYVTGIFLASFVFVVSLFCFLFVLSFFGVYQFDSIVRAAPLSLCVSHTLVETKIAKTMNHMSLRLREAKLGRSANEYILILLGKGKGAREEGIKR